MSITIPFVNSVLPVITSYSGGTVNLLVTGLQVLLGLLFVLTAGLKIVGVDEMVENFERWGYPQWFRVMTGIVEMTGGIVFIGGVVVPVLTYVGGVLLGGIMVGAIYTHVLRVDDPFSETAKPTVLLVLVGSMIILV